MRNRAGPFEPNFAWIAAAAALAIVYGSFYPFHFRGNGDLSVAIRTLIKTWRGPFGRGDFWANVLLYLPFGLFSVQVVRRLPLIARVTFVILIGLALSVSMELLQFYDEGRVPALSDVYANTIGTALGSAAGAILFRGVYPWRAGAIDRRPFIILLLSCWLGYRLFPFVPVIDLHKYWRAVKPLIFSPSLPPLDLYRHTVIWLAVALLLEALFGTARSRLVLPVFVLVVLFARVLIVDAALSPAEVAGGALAVGVWSAFLSRLRQRAPLIAAAFAAGVAMETLHGSAEVNIRSFLENVFTYGALIWLVARAGTGFAVAVALSGGLVLCLSLGQVFLPGRSAEITDPAMLLILAGVMKAMGEDPTRVTQSQRAENGWWHSVCSKFYERLTRNDSVQPADLILVLAGRMERKLYGLELYRAGVAPRLVLSVGRFEVSKMWQLDLECFDKLKSLRDATPPAERNFFVTMDASGVCLEKENLLRRSTYGEALALRRLLEREEGKTVMVVSTDVHLRRVALTFAKVFWGTAIRFLYCPVPARFAPLERDTWWRRPADRWFVINEMAKLVGYRIALSAPECAARRLMRLTGWGRK